MSKLNSYKILITNLEEIPQAVQQIISILGDQRIVLLNGNLGAGKTTITQQIVKSLGHTGSTSSPTYSLVNEYEGADGPIYHMDLYRLKDLDEAYDIGIEDYLYSGNYCFIEWPELIMDMLEGESYIQMNIEQKEDGKRCIEILLQN